jgi:hypothetical protein
MTEEDMSRVSALVRGRERVWLVYSHEWYTDPQGLAPVALEAQLCLLDSWDFYGLRVLLYARGEGSMDDQGDRRGDGAVPGRLASADRM